jgi:hypothetical protein
MLCLVVTLTGEVPWYTSLLDFGKWKPFCMEQHAHHRRLLCRSIPGTCSVRYSIDDWIKLNSVSITLSRKHAPLFG